MENKDRKETPKEKEPKKSPEARIEELIETGKQNGVLTYKEVMDTLNELELDAEQIERIYDRLEALNIYVVDEVEVPQDINEDIALKIHHRFLGAAAEDTVDAAIVIAPAFKLGLQGLDLVPPATHPQGGRLDGQGQEKGQ